jgi:uncharacterized protein DUF3828
MPRLANLSLLSVALILLGGLMASEPVAQAASAPANETPAAFVHRLYAQYRTKGGQDAVDKKFTDPDFMHLMKENAELFGAEGDADLDYDPICQCQDFVASSIYVLVDGKPSDDGGGYVAHIRRGKGKDQVDWQLVLKPIGGQWKVYDVIDQGGSVRAWVTRHNECVKAAKRDHKSIDDCAS